MDILYWVVVATVVLVVAFFMFQWQKSRAILYALMLQAKSMAKDSIIKSGEAQENWVVSRAMAFLPLPYRLFWTETVIRDIVKYLFSEAKDYMDDGKFNESIR